MKGFPRRGSDSSSIPSAPSETTSLNEGLPQKGKRSTPGAVSSSSEGHASMKGFPRRGSDLAPVTLAASMMRLPQ